MPVWGSQYGLWPASYVALTCLCAYRLTRDQRLLDWSAAVGRAYVSQPFPEQTAVPAMDAGLGLGLLADLYDITGDQSWLDGANNLAKTLLSIYFDENPLSRGAAGIDSYESKMGPGFLLHGVAGREPRGLPIDGRLYGEVDDEEQGDEENDWAIDDADTYE